MCHVARSILFSGEIIALFFSIATQIMRVRFDIFVLRPNVKVRPDKHNSLTVPKGGRGTMIVD